MNKSQSLPALTEPSITRIRPIALPATKALLWSRKQIDKKIVVKVKSVLPQISFTPKLQEALVTHKPTRSTSTFILAQRLSSEHLLTLKASQLLVVRKGDSRPKAEYVIYVNGTASGMDEALCAQIMKGIEKRVNSQDNAQPMDLCRMCLGYNLNSTSELFFHSEMLFPHADLQFVPIKPLKIVSTSLSLALVQGNSQEFAVGVLTLDKAGRALPLQRTDPLANKYPLVGVWAANIPNFSTFTGKYTEIAHPLIWAACVQFMESSGTRLSPDPSKSTFLLAHFTNKPRFYEVSCEDAYWGKIRHFTESYKDTCSFSPCLITFLREEVRGGPRHSLDSKSERKFSPEANSIIAAQQEMVAKLQGQLCMLKQQMHSLKKHKSAGRRSMGDKPPLFSFHRGVTTSQETNFTDSPLERRTPSEHTIEVPKIVYESLNHSIETEDN